MQLRSVFGSTLHNSLVPLNLSFIGVEQSEHGLRLSIPRDRDKLNANASCHHRTSDDQIPNMGTIRYRRPRSSSTCFPNIGSIRYIHRSRRRSPSTCYRQPQMRRALPCLIAHAFVRRRPTGRFGSPLPFASHWIRASPLYCSSQDQTADERYS